MRVIDNFSSGEYSNLTHCAGNQNLEIIKGDLKNFETCLKAVEGMKTVFHYAANPEVRVSTSNPEIHFNENIVATFNLLEAMRRNEVKELIFASSSSVYGEPDSLPVSEIAPVRPVSVYGASKAACENLICAYSKLYGIRALILRYANVVGPRLRHGVIYDFVNKLKENSRILEVLGDGEQVRSYLYVDDAIEATITSYKHMQHDFEIYNIGNEDYLTVNELASIVTNTLGLENVQLIYKPVAHGIGWLGDVKRIILDVTKIMNHGWKPKMSSSEAVRLTVESLAEREGLF